MAALMLAAQSPASPGDSARNTHDVFWSGENISKHLNKNICKTTQKYFLSIHLAASSPVTHCLDNRQKCRGMLLESARGEAGGARLESAEAGLLRSACAGLGLVPGTRKVSSPSQPILERRVAFRKYGVTSFKYFTWAAHEDILLKIIYSYAVLS